MTVLHLFLESVSESSPRCSVRSPGFVVTHYTLMAITNHWTELDLPTMKQVNEPSETKLSKQNKSTKHQQQITTDLNNALRTMLVLALTLNVHPATGYE